DLLGSIGNIILHFPAPFAVARIGVLLTKAGRTSELRLYYHVAFRRKRLCEIIKTNAVIASGAAMRIYNSRQIFHVRHGGLRNRQQSWDSQTVSGGQGNFSNGIYVFVAYIVSTGCEKCRLIVMSDQVIIPNIARPLDIDYDAFPVRRLIDNPH